MCGWNAQACRRSLDLLAASKSECNWVGTLLRDTRVIGLSIWVGYIIQEGFIIRRYPLYLSLGFGPFLENSFRYEKTLPIVEGDFLDNSKM